MTNPLDGNGVLEPCPNPWCYSHEPSPLAAGRRPFIHLNAEDGGPVHVKCPCCSLSGPTMDTVAAAIAAWNRRAPAPSHTAVAPVAGELEILLQWLPKLIAVLGSKPEHVDDVARLARMHALIPEQAAALVAAESNAERMERNWRTAAALVERHEATIEVQSNKLTAAETEVATLKARFKSQVDYGVHLQRIIEAICNDRPIRDDAKEGAPHHAAMATAYLARRLTHQEKNNG